MLLGLSKPHFFHSKHTNFAERYNVNARMKVCSHLSANMKKEFLQSVMLIRLSPPCAFLITIYALIPCASLSFFSIR